MKPMFIALLIALFGFAKGPKDRRCLSISSFNLLLIYFLFQPFAVRKLPLHRVFINYIFKFSNFWILMTKANNISNAC